MEINFTYWIPGLFFFPLEFIVIRVYSQHNRRAFFSANIETGKWLLHYGHISSDYRKSALNAPRLVLGRRLRGAVQQFPCAVTWQMQATLGSAYYSPFPSSQCTLLLFINPPLGNYSPTYMSSDVLSLKIQNGK